MTAHDPTTAIDPAPARRRLRLALALFAATLAAGAAARLSGPAPGDGARALARTFQAPGGGPVRFSGSLEGTAVLAGGDGLVRMELVVAADPAPARAAARVPTDLVIVLDRSGSMAGEKIAHARAAVRALVEALGPDDRFALVAYSDGAWPVVPLAPAAPPGRARWLPLVESLEPQGGTNLASGLDLALATVEAARESGRTPRVILISDGLANQGDVSPAGLRSRAGRAAAGEYALSTVGVGTDFDEGLLAALADAGTGNFHFVASAAGLAEIFAAEFETARETVASGVRVAIEPAEGVSVVDAAGYPLERDAAGGVAFRPGTLFAGQERRIWVTLRVPTSTPGEIALGRFALEYGAGGERATLAFAESPRVAAVADEDRVLAALDRASYERSVVVDQYNALRRTVAAAMQEGRAADALARIHEYRAEVGRRNARVGSAAVERQLEEAASLEAEVGDAATGAVPMAPARAKELRALGYAAGRPGSRK